MLHKINIPTIHIDQDEEGHWKIGEKAQQESGTTNDEPIFVHIGFHNKEIITIDDRDIVPAPLGIIGIGESSKKELIEILQSITIEEGEHRIIILGVDIPTPLERKYATLGDFADMVIEETREEIFIITNTLEKIEDIELKIEKHNKVNQKQAQRYHKFHNQKPRGPQGQYTRRSRK